MFPRYFSGEITNWPPASLAIIPARKFLMLLHINPKRQRGAPGCISLTLRVGMRSLEKLPRRRIVTHN